jgi:hypothetical protein
VNRSIYARFDRLEAREGINVKLPDAIVVEFVEPSEEFGNRSCRSDRAEADGHTWYPMRAKPKWISSNGCWPNCQGVAGFRHPW